MSGKKVILLISLLLITGSSYFIFYRKKDNNDEVNLVDNSDNSINDVLNEDNQEESSNSFLKYFFLFIIVIIITVIAFFAVKKVVNEKVKIGEENECFELIKLDPFVNNNNNNDNIRDKIPELKENPNYPAAFNTYIRKKAEFNAAIQELSAQKDMKKITYVLIGQMKQYYLEKKENKEKKAKIIPNKNYADNYFLVDFYYGGNFRENDEDGNVDINEVNKNKNIFFKNNEQRVRDISVFQHDYRHVVVNLFISFFEIAKEMDEFDNNEKEKNPSYEPLVYIFIAVIIQPFLYYVSQRSEKDVRFISSAETAKAVFKDIFDSISGLLRKEFLIGTIKEADLLSISYFVKAIGEQYRNTFAIIFDALVNLYFPESKGIK